MSPVERAPIPVSGVEAMDGAAQTRRCSIGGLIVEQIQLRRNGVTYQALSARDPKHGRNRQSAETNGRLDDSEPSHEANPKSDGIKHMNSTQMKWVWFRVNCRIWVQTQQLIEQKG